MNKNLFHQSNDRLHHMSLANTPVYGHVFNVFSDHHSMSRVNLIHLLAIIA